LVNTLIPQPSYAQTTSTLATGHIAQAPEQSDVIGQFLAREIKRMRNLAAKPTDAIILKELLGVLAPTAIGQRIQGITLVGNTGAFQITLKDQTVFFVGGNNELVVSGPLYEQLAQQGVSVQSRINAAQEVALDEQIANGEHIDLGSPENAELQQRVARLVSRIARERLGPHSAGLEQRINGLLERRVEGKIDTGRREGQHFSRSLIGFVSGVEGFNGHAGKQGIHLNAKLINASDEELERWLEHEIIAYLLKLTHEQVEAVQEDPEASAELLKGEIVEVRDRGPEEIRDAATPGDIYRDPHKEQQAQDYLADILARADEIAKAGEKAQKAADALDGTRKNDLEQHLSPIDRERILFAIDFARYKTGLTGDQLTLIRHAIRVAKMAENEEHVRIAEQIKSDIGKMKKRTFRFELAFFDFAVEHARLRISGQLEPASITMESWSKLLKHAMAAAYYKGPYHSASELVWMKSKLALLAEGRKDFTHGLQEFSRAVAASCINFVEVGKYAKYEIQEIDARREAVYKREHKINKVGNLVWNKLFGAFSDARTEGTGTLPVIIDLDYLPHGFERAEFARTGLRRGRSEVETQLRKRLQERLGREVRIIFASPKKSEGIDGLVDHAKRCETEYGVKPILITTDAKVAIMSTEEAGSFKDITAVIPRPKKRQRGLEPLYLDTAAITGFAVCKSMLTQADLEQGRDSQKLRMLSELSKEVTGKALNLEAIGPEVLSDKRRFALSMALGLPNAVPLYDKGEMRDLWKAEILMLKNA